MLKDKEVLQAAGPAGDVLRSGPACMLRLSEDCRYYPSDRRTKRGRPVCSLDETECIM